VVAHRASGTYPDAHLRDLRGPGAGVPSADADLTLALRRTLHDVLQSVLGPGRACVLLDFPNHTNVGDSLIWMGERALLDRYGIRVIYTADRRTFSTTALRRLPRAVPILFHGGGNLGDLWPAHEAFREAVIAAFPDRPMVILPHTVTFVHRAAVERAGAILRRHPHLTVLVRDTESLQIARHELGVRAILCPDPAFALDALPGVADPPARRGAGRVLLLLRRDHEAAPTTGQHPTAVDWVTLTGRDWVPLGRHVARIVLADVRVRWAHRVAATAPVPLPAVSARLAAYDALAAWQVRRGVRLIADSEVVVTDRLHGHILAMLLGRPHVLLDDRYGKLRRFFRTWTHPSPLVHWARTVDEAMDLAAALAQSRSAATAMRPAAPPAHAGDRRDDARGPRPWWPRAG
jgi:pyruvyl transferase EpsO